VELQESGRDNAVLWTCQGEARHLCFL